MDVQFDVSVFARHLAAVANGAEAVQLCVLGNAPELGDWDTNRAVVLSLVEESTAEKRFTGVVQFPAERLFFPLEYKYIIKDSTANEVVAWESIPGNRTFTLTNAANIARGKPSSQSSTHQSDRMPCPGPRPAMLGNNGDRNGFHEWRCPRTTREPNPWWTVDLQTRHVLEHVTLWKSTTYHEAAKRSVTKPPASVVRQAQRSSVLPPPPVRIFISSEDLSEKPAAELIQLAKAPGSLPASILAIQLKTHEDKRVEGVSLGGIAGQYVRVQYESDVATSLQFAELELFASDQASSGSIQRRDGFFGVDAAVDSDLHEYVDHEWVDPQSGLAMLRVWLGSFRKEEPAVQWFSTDSSANGGVHVELRHEVHSRSLSSGDASSTALPVDSRGASLLDKDGAAFRAALTAMTQRELRPFVNSTGSASIDAWLDRFKTTQLLSEDQLTRIKTLATTRAFHDGNVLLQYGERARMAFFITSGDVQVSGPASVTGSIPLGVLPAGSAINDLALFSKWPQRSATFSAKGEVLARVVTYAMLLEVVGEEKLRALRHHLIRERHALAPAEANTKLLTVDSEHAQVFRTKLPLKALAKSGGEAIHKLFLDVYEATDIGSTPITSVTDKGELLGSAPLLPSQLNVHGEGHLTLPILSPASHDVVGQVSLHYLVVKPFIHPKNNLSSTWRSYWRERVPLNGGHRGMGRHFNQVGGFRKALTRENTLASFLLAGKTGADFVEFDVQLTKDHVPILYHDFIFRVGLEDARAWTQGTRAEQHEIAIHRLTYRELVRTQTSPVPRKEMPKLKRLIKKHWTSILSQRNNNSSTSSEAPRVVSLELPSHDSEDHLVDLYPRLEDLLVHVPPEIALNIEIKYPDDFKRSAYRFSPSFALDYYIDRILTCVFDHAGVGRRIFFSCFDPVFVVALRAKQATFPVFFLTYGRIEAPAFDARLTMQFAHNFVKMERLAGIVSNSDHLLTTPAAVELVKRDGVVLMTWGDQNTSHACVQQQKQSGIDGVISDNIMDLSREDERARSSASKATSHY